jgi:phospholipase C
MSLVTKRFDLPMLSGLQGRNAAVAANGHPPLGDLTNALDLGSR